MYSIYQQTILRNTLVLQAFRYTKTTTIKYSFTTTNVLQFYSTVHRVFCNRLQTGVIYTDFSKAFSSLNHSLLLQICSNNILKWIGSYARTMIRRTHRTQRVLFRNTNPRLYRFHVFHMEVTLVGFSTIYFSLTARNVSLWPFIAADPYYIGNHVLDRVLSLKNLGVLFYHRLSFKDYIYVAVNNARGMLSFIKRWSKEFNDPFTTKTINVFVLWHILEYCSCFEVSFLESAMFRSSTLYRFCFLYSR